MKRLPRKRASRAAARRVEAALAKIRGALQRDPSIRERTRAYFAGDLEEGPKGAA